MQSRVVGTGAQGSWRLRGQRDRPCSPGGAGMVNAGEGTDLVMTDDAAAGNGASQEERIAQGTAVHEQIARGASLRRQNRQAAPEGGRIGTPEQARVGTPGRRAEAPGEGRVPGWLQTGAAWSWRVLVSAGVSYLIA